MSTRAFFAPKPSEGRTRSQEKGNTLLGQKRGKKNPLFMSKAETAFYPKAIELQVYLLIEATESGKYFSINI